MFQLNVEKALGKELEELGVERVSKASASISEAELSDAGSLNGTSDYLRKFLHHGRR